jgi:predicted amidohydrolase YtcJ
LIDPPEGAESVQTVTRPIKLRGRIATLQGNRGFGWTDSIVIRGGIVDRASSVPDEDAHVVDLDPDFVAAPALTDAHLHLGMVAEARLATDLGRDMSLADVRRRLLRAAARTPLGSWVVGYGLRVDLWGRWPALTEFDDFALDRPIVLWAHDHHSVWANRAAMAIAHVGRETETPPGGEIRRDSTGETTGVFIEDARQLVLKAVPPSTDEQRLVALESATASLLASGIVAVHDPGPMVSDPELQAAKLLKRADESGRLPIDVTLSVQRENLEAAASDGLASGQPLSHAPEPRARIGWLKLFADGTLGSGTAAAGAEGANNLAYDDSELRRLVEKAAALGFATQIHAIGNVAVRSALDALESASPRHLRHRIEHAQLVDVADIDRFRDLRIAASVQPVHLATDESLAASQWGRLDALHYPWASFLRAGARLLLGTDAPVELPDPWRNLAIAVRRRDDPTARTRERLRVDEALRAATVSPALMIEEFHRGRLTSGHRADVVVVRRSGLRHAAEGRFEPEAVIAGGQLVAGDLSGWPDARRSDIADAESG